MRHKLNHSTATSKELAKIRTVLESDPAFIEYINHLKAIRNNNGHVSRASQINAVAAVRQFLNYTDIPITNHALSDLIAYKKASPASTDIEQAVRAFSLEEPIKYYSSRASGLLGIFRANFTPLQLRVNTHFEPVQEDCTEEIFREILAHLTPEQRDMIQWNIYFPQRATAAYRVPYEAIDLSRSDYAIVWFQAHSENYTNKARVTHPCLVPINFAKRIIANGRAVGRTEPFRNHRGEWNQITRFAKTEFGVRLVSNYCRKFFEDKAEDSKLAPSVSAFLMGDKTKLAQTGHLPLFYNNKLKFIEKIVQAYKESGLEHLLNITNPPSTKTSEVERLKAEIEQLKEQLDAMGRETALP